MTLEEAITKYSDERTNHYLGLAARLGFAAALVSTVCLAGWFVFERYALGSPAGLRNALLVSVPVVLGMAVFTALQVHWKATR